MLHGTYLCQHTNLSDKPVIVKQTEKYYFLFQKLDIVRHVICDAEHNSSTSFNSLCESLCLLRSKCASSAPPNWRRASIRPMCRLTHALLLFVPGILCNSREFPGHCATLQRHHLISRHFLEGTGHFPFVVKTDG